MTGASTSASGRAPRDGLGQMLLTARLFFTAPGWGLVLLRTLVWTLCAQSLVNLIDRDSHSLTTAVVIFSAGFFLPWLAVMTLDIEVTHARPLSYLELLPQRTRPLHLVLWPMRLLGIVAVILFTSVGHLPALAAVILAACAWWSVSVGHWLAGHGVLRRTLVFVPVGLQASLVAVLATSVSLPAAAVFAVGTALLTVVIPHRIAFGRLLTGAVARISAVEGKTHPIPDRPRRPWGTNYQLFKLAAFSVPGSRWLMVSTFVLAVTNILLSVLSFSSSVWLAWLNTALFASSGLGRTMEVAKVDFFITRPFSARRRFVVMVLPWIGMALSGPLAQALLIKPSTTAMPSYGNTIRSGFLALALLLVAPLLSVARNLAPRLRWLAWGVTLAACAAMLPYYLVAFGQSHVPLPPLWLAAVLACVSAALFYRQVFSRNLT